MYAWANHLRPFIAPQLLFPHYCAAPLSSVHCGPTAPSAIFTSQTCFIPSHYVLWRGNNIGSSCTPYLENMLKFKETVGNSVKLQCLLCVPKITEVKGNFTSTYKMNIHLEVSIHVQSNERLISCFLFNLLCKYRHWYFSWPHLFGPRVWLDPQTSNP